MKAIGTPIDFLGMNYYSRNVMEAGPDGKPEAVKPVPSQELTDMEWEVFPEGLYDGLMRIHKDYKPRKIFIAENGAAYKYPADSHGHIADVKRITYFRDHLLAARRAINEGVPLEGYFAWSLMDNFEWGFGYAKRFGLFALDYETQHRTPKDSAFWYRNVASTNAIDDAFTPTDLGEARALDSQK